MKNRSKSWKKIEMTPRVKNNTVNNIRKKKKIKTKKPTMNNPKRRQPSFSNKSTPVFSPSFTPLLSSADRCELLKRELEYLRGILEEQKKLRRELKTALKDLPPTPNSSLWFADINLLSLPELKEHQRVLQRSQFLLALAAQRLRFSKPREEIEKEHEAEE